MKDLSFKELDFERLEHYLRFYSRLKNQLCFENVLHTRFEMLPTEYCYKEGSRNEIDPLLEELPGFILDVEVSQKRLDNYRRLQAGKLTRL